MKRNSRTPLHSHSATLPHKQSRLDYPLLAAVGLIVQAFWAFRLQGPSYMDAYYYATNGRRLAAGFGFTEEIIWQFLGDPAGLPTPSHTYWMPLPSMLAAAGYRLYSGFRGGQLFFWLLAGLLPLLAYIISRRLSGQRWQGWAAALFTAAGSYYAAYLSQPSTFTPFAWAGALGLLALGLATLGGKKSEPGQLAQDDGKGRGNAISRFRGLPLCWLLAGLMAGLAHLTRPDGFFLLLVGLGIWILTFQRWRQSPSLSEQEAVRKRPGISLALLLGGYLLVMGGWLLRNWLITGGPLPAAGLQGIFLVSYDDLFAYDRAISLNSFLSWGWGNILRSRLQGTWLAVQTLVAVPGLIFLTPFVLVGFLSHYRRSKGRLLLRPVLWFAIVIFIAFSWLFTFPGMRGSLLHSSVALWPWSTALAAAGIDRTVDWAAARLSHWKPERAKRTFSALFIVLAFVLSLAVSQYRLTPTEDPDIFRQIGATLPPEAVVMVGNAPAMHYHTGLASITVPNEPLPVVLQAADRYGATYLLLNKDRPLPLKDLYEGNSHHPRLQLLHTIEDVQLYRIKGAGET